MTFPIVDAHVHVGLTKYVAVDVLIAQMDTAGVDQALLVQYGGCTDNAYLQQCMRRYPGRLAALGAVEYEAPEAAQRIRDEVPRFGLAGLRIPAGLEREDVWAALDELGSIASLTGGMEALLAPGVVRCITDHPRIHFRLEHMGWVRSTRDPEQVARFERVLDYALYPNVLLMLSGFYGFAGTYPHDEAVPLVRRALERFGPQRLMWGSDFPPVACHETYEMSLEMIRRWDFLDEEARRWILGGTARKLLDFSSPSG